MKLKNKKMSKKIFPNVLLWRKYYKKNIYYHNYLENLTADIIPRNASVLEFSSKCGELLQKLPNKVKVGVETDPEFVEYCSKNKRSLNIYSYDKFFHNHKKKYDYIILSNTLSSLNDSQYFLNSLNSICHSNSRIIVFYFNYLWKPILDLAEKIGEKIPDKNIPNWLSEDDVDNLFHLESYEKISSSKRFLFPYKIPLIHTLFNTYASPLPIINSFSLINYSVYRPIPVKKEYSVSIIIPARNESGNMKGILNKIPKFSKNTEVVFVEGHSKDDTYKAIKNEILRYNGPFKVSLYKQKGKGKGDAVRLGFSKAKNDLLIILDADLTVDPRELIKFYNAACLGKGDLIMGSRLIYPMEKMAMRTLNILGNKFFSVVFSYLLDQKIRDTLCGTKVLLKSDYNRIAKNRYIFGDFDPFGDYDLIFGSAKLNLKILEIPIRYKERVYGKTNISRFSHGWLLLKMVAFAAKRLKFV